MLISLAGRNPATVSAEAWGALRQLRWDTDQAPAVLAYSPVAKANPFQQALYGGLLDRNILPVPAYDDGTAGNLLTSLPDEVQKVLHLHWLNVVLAKAGDLADARRKMDDFVDRIARLKDHGVKLIWTVHNVLPHDVKHEGAEVELRERIIALADVVHVMSTRTPEMVAPWFALPPDRTYQCDHPGYQGVYPRWVSRAAARQELGLPPDALVWLLMGAIKPYKGLTELLDAVDVVSREQPGRVALLVAGQPDRNGETNAFLDRAGAHPSVWLYPKKVIPDDVQLMFHAADVAAVPYRRSLNSGALILGLTFGLPAVLPSASGGLPLVDDEAAVVYDQDDPDGLVVALRESRRLLAPESRAAAELSGARLDRATVAERFARDIRGWLDNVPLPLFPTEPVPYVRGGVAGTSTRAEASA